MKWRVQQKKAKVTQPVTRELKTFLSWGKSESIGHQVENIDGKELVTKIWCKLCARYKDHLQKDASKKGAIVNSLKAFIDGTNAV